MIEFLLFILCSFILYQVFYVTKEFKSNLFLIMWGYTFLFVTPVIYIFYGGEKYRVFSDESALTFYLLGCLSAAFIILMLLFKVSLNRIKICKINLFISDFILKIIFSFCIVFVVLYILFYWREWPFFDFVSGDISGRPDIVKGTFQGFFIYSLFTSIIIPGIYFHLKDKKGKLFNLLFFIFVCFSMVVSGNKGVFLYFIIFNVLFEWKKIRLSTYLIIIVGLMAIYALIRLPFIGDNFSLSYLIESISERIFLTQGMAMPAVIELAKSTDVTMMNSNDLKYTLFNFVYGYSPGSMPLFYTAELYVRYGWLMMSFISVIISLVFGFGAFVINKTKDSAIRWVYYISLYALIMGGVGSANLFFFIVAILWWLLLTLSNGTITSRSGK
ncbi:hypothetical protein GBT23_01860 [Escherichia coli]|uniref:O61 family O-antigen polymerase n=1 Tax=Escherichia coli TaxID=562 RepID=UPI0014822A04|nr:O61 family O-antigen polymerase [Escherichia coli]EMD2347269.1 O61 family O-antigen polymerase [Escherichia coli]MDA6796083.1 O61 family O-antigen polymerase [Escherichia coli]NNR65163.1 hypothetical protein [Escherichia coli]NNR70448.1 hypothetical protein [Escherichia coli]